MDSIRDRHFTIIGCGSLGTLLARVLARLGAHKFHLIDSERVEMRHLNREVFAHEQIGENKAAALSQQLRAIHPRVRSVTTGQPFDSDLLWSDKEDVIICSTSDVGVPQRVIETAREWEEAHRPAVFVTRHTGLIGGYWMADLRKEPDARVPPLAWLVPTGSDAPDARSRIATTAHAVAGLTSQAIVAYLQGQALRSLVTVDLAALILEPQGSTNES